MYPNMTRSLAECRDALAYVHEVETFSAIDKILVQNVGAVGMSFAHGKIKKKHGISDERAALYARLDEWARHLKSRREAGSTSVVNLGDLAVYGVLNCARGQRTWDDILKHDQGVIDGWLSDMDESIPEEILVR